MTDEAAGERERPSRLKAALSLSALEIRNLIVFVAILLVIYEAVVMRAERIGLLALYATMLGLPVVWPGGGPKGPTPPAVT